MQDNRKGLTSIASLGEFGLIRHLTQNLQSSNASTVCGVGDDAAILKFDDGVQTLVTTDMLMEGVHFNLAYTPLKHLGYKAVAVNLSDVYAMNGRPTQITVSLAMSQKFALEDVEELYAGMRLAADRYGVDIVGGDTCASRTGLAISITCIGVAAGDKVVRRGGASGTDLICVSGDLGAAYMGLMFLERENRVFLQTGSQPDSDGADFAAHNYIIERQLKPEPRRDVVEALDRIGVVPTAMMDVSDGLSSELLHICQQSGVGCRVYEDRIPIDYQTAVMAEELNMNVTTAALNGGEDYELLFCVPVDKHDVFVSLPGVKIIGHTTDPALGCALITRDGSEMALKAQGWNAFSDNGAEVDNASNASDASSDGGSI